MTQWSVQKMATKIMPVSDLRRQTSQVIQSVLRDGDVVYVTQYGRPTVVLVEYEQYEALLAQSEQTVPTQAAEIEASRETTVAITVQLSAEEARRLVNREIVPELGTGLGAKQPDLLLRGEQVIWRVPIVLSLAQLGDLGEVGIIEVDAQTGAILNKDNSHERILQHAQRLYAGATLPAE
jgi:prevent-host-death family protein